MHPVHGISNENLIRPANAIIMDTSFPRHRSRPTQFYLGLFLQIDMQLLPRHVHPDAERRARTPYKGEYKSALPHQQPIQVDGTVAYEGKVRIYLNFRVNLGDGCKYCVQCI